MYGRIGRITVAPGARDALVAILSEGTKAMPGCLRYELAADGTDDDVLWVSEVWDAEASHRASLQLPAVQAAISKGRAWIQGMETIAVTRPLGDVPAT